MTHVGKFKVAVVGVSSDSAKEFLPEIFYSHITKLVAVCDENCAALKKVCEAYMISGYSTYEDLIENEEIDFAILTIPHGRQNETKRISKTGNKKRSKSDLATSSAI